MEVAAGRGAYRDALGEGLGPLGAEPVVGLGGSRRGEIRIEMLNITNTVKTTGPVTTVGSTTFGQIRTQSGFMRLTQLTFRMSFYEGLRA